MELPVYPFYRTACSLVPLASGCYSPEWAWATVGQPCPASHFFSTWKTLGEEKSTLMVSNGHSSTQAADSSSCPSIIAAPFIYWNVSTLSFDCERHPVHFFLLNCTRYNQPITYSHALSTWTFHGWCPRSKSVFSWELRIMEYWIALSRDDESAWIDGSSHGATPSRCFCFRLHLLVPILVALMAPQLWSALPSPGLLKLLWPCRKINVLSSLWLHRLCTTMNYPGISECTTITVLRVLPSFGLFSPTILEH